MRGALRIEANGCQPYCRGDASPGGPRPGLHQAKAFFLQYTIQEFVEKVADNTGQCGWGGAAKKFWRRKILDA
jgi:hypothetical protein